MRTYAQPSARASENSLLGHLPDARSIGAIIPIVPIIPMPGIVGVAGIIGEPLAGVSSGDVMGVDPMTPLCADSSSMDPPSPQAAIAPRRSTNTRALISGPPLPI
jgi:hypothetical protein